MIHSASTTTYKTMKNTDIVNDYSSSASQEEKIHELQVYEQQLQSLEEELNRRKEHLEHRKHALENMDPNEQLRPETMCEKFTRLCCPPFSPGNINSEIPLKLQQFVWNMYYLWLFNAFCIIFNTIVMLVLNNHHQRVQDFNIYIPLSILYVVVGIPMSWYIWYRRIFKSVSLQSRVRFMIFNMNFMAHIIFVVIMTLGFSNVDAGGLITMILLYADHQSDLGTLTLVSTCFWFLDMVSTFVCYKRAFDAHEQIQLIKFIHDKFDDVTVVN